jgi:hypothetical protein
MLMFDLIECTLNNPTIGLVNKSITKLNLYILITVLNIILRKIKGFLLKILFQNSFEKFNFLLQSKIFIRRKK